LLLLGDPLLLDAVRFPGLEPEVSPELLLCVLVPSTAVVLLPSPSLESSEESPVNGIDLIWLALPFTVAYTGTGMS
jgi:hypothetical protein